MQPFFEVKIEDMLSYAAVTLDSLGPIMWVFIGSALAFFLAGGIMKIFKMIQNLKDGI